MKGQSLLLIGLLCLLYSTSYSKTYNVLTSGNTYTPDSIAVHLGDTIVFQLGQYHNFVEVNKNTWDANDTIFNGGYQLPFGGGTIVFNTLDTIYYVCRPHAYLGMKGIIVVLSDEFVSVGNNEDVKNQLKIYPNPVVDELNIELTSATRDITSVLLFDITGRMIWQSHSLDFSDGSAIATISMKGFSPGYYFVRTNSLQNRATVKVLKVE